MDSNPIDSTFFIVEVNGQTITSKFNHQKWDPTILFFYSVYCRQKLMREHRVSEVNYHDTRRSNAGNRNQVVPIISRDSAAHESQETVEHDLEIMG